MVFWAPILFAISIILDDDGDYNIIYLLLLVIAVLILVLIYPQTQIL